MKPNRQQYIEAARREYGCGGEIEIDSNAKISRSPDAGAYVQAWVWVNNEEVLLTNQEKGLHDHEANPTTHRREPRTA